MAKYNIKMTIVTPTSIPSDRLIELDLCKFVVADNLRKMLYKAVNLKKDFIRVKHLNVKIEE